MCLKRKFEAYSCNHWGSGKTVTVTYSESLFVALIIQHALHMRNNVICDLPNSSRFFHFISQIYHDIREKLSDKICFFWFSLQTRPNIFSFQDELSDIDQTIYTDLHVFVIPVIFWWNLSFLDIFSINSQISNLVKIRPVGAALFHADKRTDRLTDITKLIVASRNFVNMSKTV